MIYLRRLRLPPLRHQHRPQAGAEQLQKLKPTFLSYKLTFLSYKLTFLSLKLTFLSLSPGVSSCHLCKLRRLPLGCHCNSGVNRQVWTGCQSELRNVSLELRNVSLELRNVSFQREAAAHLSVLLAAPTLGHQALKLPRDDALPNFLSSKLTFPSSKLGGATTTPDIDHKLPIQVCRHSLVLRNLSLVLRNLVLELRNLS
jgi:hypothetical protein